MLPTAASLFERLPRSFRRHKLMVGWMRLMREDPLQLVRIREDAFGYADLTNGFLRLIVIDGEFETSFFRIADALLKDGGEFFDVGANHGLFSFGLARRPSKNIRFHIFEPNSALQVSIAKSLGLYPTMQATIISEAASDHDGFVQFQIDPEQSGRSHVVATEGVPVRSIKLDTYIKTQGVPRIDLMKIDIEGYELAALRGAEEALKSRRIKAIYFEYCEVLLVRNHPPVELLKFLDLLSYEVCLCHSGDMAAPGLRKMTLRSGLPGNGLLISPIRGQDVPPNTDLLAIPRENLVEAS